MEENRVQWYGYAGVRHTIRTMNAPASKSEIKRTEIIQAVALHLLEEGFNNSGIRALASSAGLKSDRMLMYYFETKEELVTAALMWIADGLEAQLETIMPANSASANEILETLTAAGRTKAVRPMIRLFFEVVGLSVRGEEPYASIVRIILKNWESWIERKLRANQKHRAPEILAALEGTLMVELLTQP